MTTSDYLEQLQQDREDLIDNLETKGITGLTGDETFTELVPEVLNIQSGADLSEYFTTEYNSIPSDGMATNALKKYPDIYVGNNVTDLSYSTGFKTNIVPKIICGNNIITMSKMYGNAENVAYDKFICSNATNIDVSGLDTSNVQSMSYMFAKCGKLQTVNLSNFNTSNLLNMASMFSSCTSLTSITFGNNFDTSSVSQMNGMFSGCTSLTSLDLSSFTSDAITGTSATNNMFASCTSLTKIDFRNFDFTNAHHSMFGSSAQYGVPDNCLIIVKDQTQKDWFATGNTARLTNVQTVSEYEASLT